MFKQILNKSFLGKFETIKSTQSYFKFSLRSFADAKKAEAKKPEAKKEEIKKEEQKKEEVKKPEAEAKPQQAEPKKQEPLNQGLRQINPERLSSYKEVIDGLNKDWKKVAQEKESYRIKKVKDEMLPSQRKYIEMIAKKVVGLNYFQIEHIFKKIQERGKGIKKIAPISINTQWYELQKDLGNQIPTETLRFTNHEELMKNLSKWYSSQIPGFGIGAGTPGAAPQAQEKKEDKKAEKKEEKKEKESYDIELTSFDAAKKIALIKEVRGALNLGLKEAKELVEKAPVVLMKGIKKADSEAIIKKLAENGGVITLK